MDGLKQRVSRDSLVDGSAIITYLDKDLRPWGTRDHHH
jgi:hypothetical protein